MLVISFLLECCIDSLFLLSQSDGESAPPYSKQAIEIIDRIQQREADNALAFDQFKSLLEGLSEEQARFGWCPFMHAVFTYTLQVSCLHYHIELDYSSFYIAKPILEEL